MKVIHVDVRHRHDVGTDLVDRRQWMASTEMSHEHRERRVGHDSHTTDLDDHGRVSDPGDADRARSRHLDNPSRPAAEAFSTRSRWSRWSANTPCDRS